MKKVFLALAVGAVALGFLWMKSAAPVAAPPSAGEKAPPPAARPAGPTPVAPAGSRWGLVGPRESGLRTLSEADLNNLYVDAATAIRADQAGMAKHFVESIPSYTRRPLVEGLFEISAWNRYGDSPSRLAQALFEYVPPAEAEPRSSHMAPSTDAGQLRKLQAFSLRDLRDQLGKGTAHVSGEERGKMVALLSARAGTEKSLDVSLEIFQLLAFWKEKDAIENGLRQRSARDQELIRGVIAE
jgi:hypothetical protein